RRTAGSRPGAAPAFFADLRQGGRGPESRWDPTAGEVRIATREPIAAGILPVVIGRLSRRYPRLSIYVTQSPIAMLQQSVPQYADLRERKVDLVFGPVVKRVADDDLTTEILFRQNIHVVAHARHPCPPPTRITLTDRPWCLPPLASLLGLRCMEAFRSNGLDLPRRTVTSVSMQLQMGLVTTQSYLTMHPSSLVRFAGRRFAVKALPIKLAVEPRLIGIITLKNRTISPAAQVFVQAVREAAKPMAKPRKRE